MVWIWPYNRVIDRWTLLVVRVWIIRRVEILKNSPSNVFTRNPKQPAQTQHVALPTGPSRPASPYCTFNIQPVPNYPFPTHPASRTNARFRSKDGDQAVGWDHCHAAPHPALDIWPPFPEKAKEWLASATSIPVYRSTPVCPAPSHRSKGIQ